MIAVYRLFIMLNWLGLSTMGCIQWMRVFVASRFANFYVAQGANVYRAIKLKQAYSFSYSASVGLSTVITCFDAASTLFVTALLIFTRGRLQSRMGFLMLGAAVGLVGALAAVPCLTRLASRRKIAADNRWVGWFADRLEAMSGVLARCTQSGPTIGFIGGMNILVYLTYLLSVYVCLTGFEQHVSMSNAALITSAFVLSRTINIVPGNLGVSELITGLSAGALAGGVIYGVMISVIFRVIDFAVIGTAFLAFSLTDLGKKAAEGSR